MLLNCCKFRYVFIYTYITVAISYAKINQRIQKYEQRKKQILQTKVASLCLFETTTKRSDVLTFQILSLHLEVLIA